MRSIIMKAAAVFVVSLVILTLKGIEFSEGTGVKLKFNITVLTDNKRERIVKSYVKNYIKLNAIPSHLLNIHVMGIKEDFSNLLSLLKQLSNSDRLKESSFVIADLTISSSLLSSFLATTSTVVFDIRNRPLDFSNVLLTNVISMRPSMEEQGKAMEHFVERMRFKKILKLNNCFLRSERNTFDTAEEITRQLNKIKLEDPEVIIVKCPGDIEAILKQAKYLEMGDNWKWILPDVIGYKRVTSYVHEKLLAFAGHHSHDVSTPQEEDYLSYVEDSLAVIQRLAREIKNHNLGSEKMDMNVIRSILKRFDFQGQTGNIQFNNEGCRSNVTYDIFEMVTIVGERRWLRVGSWLDGKVNTIFMHWTGHDSWSSRQALRVVTYYGEPWVNLASVQTKFQGRCLVGHVCQNYTNKNTPKTSDTANQEDCCSGFMMDLLSKLEELLNFESRVHFVKDGKFGSQNGSRSSRWSGMIGELERGEADIALHLLTITAERLKVVAFSQPYMEAANGILVSSRPFSHSVWEFVFLETFSGELWLGFGLVCFMVVMVIWFAERLRLRRLYLVKPNKYHRSFNFLETITYTCSLAFQKAAEEVGPTSLTGRLLAGLFAVFAIIACSSFTANLAAIKVTERRGISITGIHDSRFQNPSEDFKFSTLSDSAGLDYFRENSDPALKKMASSLEMNAVNTLAEASKKLQTRKIHAFLSDIPMLKILAYEENCDLKLVGKSFFFSGYGIAFFKNFFWQSQFSLAVLQLQEEGFFDQLAAKWIPQHCQHSDKLRGPERLGVNEVGGTLLLLILGSCVGALLLIIEIWIWRSCYQSK